MKKFSVSSDCVFCGLCTVTDTFLQEDNTGCVVPIPGKFIVDSNLDEAMQLVKNCPVGALSLVETEGIATEKNNKISMDEIHTQEKSKDKKKNSSPKTSKKVATKKESAHNISRKDFISKAEKCLLAISGLKRPELSDFPYNSSEFSIPCYGAVGQWSYDYSSYSSADNAAEREFNSKAYSQLKPFALKLVMQYKSKYLALYYADGKNRIYEKKNAEIKKVLKEIAGEYECLFGKKLDKSFTDFDVLPDTYRDSMFDMLKRDTVFSDEVAERIANKHRSEYPISEYHSYWDIDSEEKYAGKGLFGDKYKTVYCYSGVEKANEELAKDLLWVAGYIDINVTAHDKACVVVSEYNTNMQKEIKKKIEMLKKS